MNQILVIAWREITRLRKRFGGGGSPLTVLILLGVLGFTSYTLRDSVTLGNGLYRVGTSGNVPAINDSRFAVMAFFSLASRLLIVLVSIVISLSLRMTN